MQNRSSSESHWFGYVSTSYVERQNLTMGMHMRPFTRLTNAFSKKLENHITAISQHFMYYGPALGQALKTGANSSNSVL
jgi:IS1 family transposase